VLVCRAQFAPNSDERLTGGAPARRVTWGPVGGKTDRRRMTRVRGGSSRQAKVEAFSGQAPNRERTFQAEGRPSRAGKRASCTNVSGWPGNAERRTTGAFDRPGNSPETLAIKNYENKGRSSRAACDTGAAGGRWAGLQKWPLLLTSGWHPRRPRAQKNAFVAHSG